MLADDISHGHGWGADVFFLLAVICALVAAVIYIATRRRPATGAPVRADVAVWAPVMWSLTLAFTALGLLVL